MSFLKDATRCSCPRLRPLYMQQNFQARLSSHSYTSLSQHTMPRKVVLWSSLRRQQYMIGLLSMCILWLEGLLHKSNGSSSAERCFPFEIPEMFVTVKSGCNPSSAEDWKSRNQFFTTKIFRGRIKFCRRGCHAALSNSTICSSVMDLDADLLFQIWIKVRGED